MEEGGGTRELILQTALKLFSRRGYGSTGIQEIVSGAGITKPTLYYYFGNKRGLLEAIVARYGGELEDLTRRAAEYHHNLEMNLRDLFRETLRFARENPAFYRLWVSLYASAPEAPGYDLGNSLRRRLTVAMERLFASATADHGNMRDRQAMYAAAFMGLMETWAILVLNGEADIQDNTQFRIIHQYMHGIFS